MSQAQAAPHSRINVVGTSGSGKSTFSKRLAKIIHAPLIEMDQLFWLPNWKEPSDSDFLGKLQQELKGETWVLDGNYNRSVPVKWEKVQAVIWLDFPFSTTLIRAIKRALRRSLTQEELWPGTGNRESFRKSFLSRDSIILWTMKTHGQNRRRYEAMSKDPRYSHIKFIKLQSDEEVETFLANLNQSWEPLTPNDLRPLLSKFHGEWAVAGGWAIDLKIGQQTRNHEDIDVLVPRQFQLEIQRVLRDWELWVADPPGLLRRWKHGEMIGKGRQDIWCRPSKDAAWKLQFMLIDTDGDDWVYKRGFGIRKPLSEIFVRSNTGIKFLAPEVQLLHKAKSLREKDHTDFANVVKVLDSQQRLWLKKALEAEHGREHPWILRL